MIALLPYVASTVGFNFIGAEDDSRLQNGLRFRLRESHRLESEPIYKVASFIWYLNSAEVVDVE